MSTERPCVDLGFGRIGNLAAGEGGVGWGHKRNREGQGREEQSSVEARRGTESAAYWTVCQQDGRREQRIARSCSIECSHVCVYMQLYWEVLCFE
jgi:hypothetical protein